MAMGPITVPGTEAAQAANSTSVSQTPVTPSPSGTVPPSPAGQVPPTPTSTDTSSGKTIAVILCLLFVYPLGVILMYVLTKWKWWVKLLLTLPAILFIVGVAVAAVLIAMDPQGQLKKAECMAQCQESPNVQSCVTQCIEIPVPTTGIPIGGDRIDDAREVREDMEMRDAEMQDMMETTEDATSAASE